MNLQRPRNFQNAAAIAELAIVEKTDINTLTVSGPEVIALSLKPLKDWTFLYFTPFTASYNESVKETENGRVYSFAVAGFYPTDSAEARAFLANLDMRRYVIAIRDAHSTIRVIGNKTHGLTPSYDLAIEAEMGGRRGTIIQFSGELPFPGAIWEL